MEEPALYLPDGDAFVGTNLIQGGWNPDEANGAAVLALLGHCLEDVPTLVPMTVSRFTADLVRPVPLGRPLRVTTSIRREGKKIQVVELQLLVGEVEHVRATVLRLRDADLTGGRLPASTTDARPADALVPVEAVSGPREAHPDGPGYLPGFLQGIDLRRAPTVDGTSFGSWVRLEASVVAGEPIRSTSRLTVGFDFANLIGVNDHVPTVTMINPDVTAHVLRAPVDDWIAVTGDTRFNPAMGRGVSSAALSDSQGVFATASVSQLLQYR
ncbi:thioesterase family protein [Rhabdothermincola salaria]|uniref:thioesterase family protein n=1 Tax=Rhabdothermincola salaria TaxID=2903142 RepID=UPI001E43F2DD|nr:thioesterase family protein [Rhabdothermincola salaria]